jgi:AAT family amino acid transporter
MMAIVILLPLIPTEVLSAEESLFVAALRRWGLGWAGTIMNIVLVTAILSTMLAAMFGLGRMIRSLADEGHAPAWIRDEGDIPYRGILFSGTAMLVGLGLGFILPQQVYLFLVSSGGFALLFAYVVILATHNKYRKTHGCPPRGNCQLPGFPYTSWFTLAGCMAIIASMPLIPGQSSGLVAGLALILLYTGIYFVFKRSLVRTIKGSGADADQHRRTTLSGLEPQFELSEELTGKQAEDPESKKGR